MKKFSEYYLDFFESTELNLRDMTEETANLSSEPGKWTRKEILGHLIDSAANNHLRFVGSLFTDDLLFTSYDQDAWVKVQHYKESTWESLVTLWVAYNKHIIHFIDTIPEEILTEPREVHNLNEICYQPAPADEPATLEYLVEDYFDHMQHHLESIFS
ncbi:MAG: DinB family protein [Ignavibacteriaceae bacterium]|nr:DinB family protein [Ignavibacteriaceae bacterium]